MSLNPNGPNEDFQTSQVRRYGEAIYQSTVDKLVDAITVTLGLQDEKDSLGDPIRMDFDYAYAKLIESGHCLTHKFIENEGTCTLEIKIYKECTVVNHDVKTTFGVTIV